MAMNNYKNGDMVVAANGETGLVVDGSVFWTGDPHGDDEISFIVRYTEQGAELLGDQQTPDTPVYFPVCEIGAKGLTVLLAQTALKCKGYYHGNLDGDFGKMTYEAVRKFREDNYLQGDSVLDDDCYKFLFRE